MKKIYIASPYTKGDIAVNVRRQIDAVNELMDLGYAPFAPLYSHFQHMIHPRPYQDWLNVDMEWVKSCDAVLRLDGESSGADQEVALAESLNIPVFYSIDELQDYVEEDCLDEDMCEDCNCMEDDSDEDYLDEEDYPTFNSGTWEKVNGRGFWGNPTTGYIKDEDLDKFA